LGKEDDHQRATRCPGSSPDGRRRQEIGRSPQEGICISGEIVPTMIVERGRIGPRHGQRLSRGFNRHIRRGLMIGGDVALELDLLTIFSRS
jgi:hypothetical protein